MTRVAVLVSTRIDPVSGRRTRSATDAAAVMLALAIDPNAMLVTAGDMPESVARDYLALGVGEITLLSGVPSTGIAQALAEATGGADLIVAGARGEGGLGSGLVPYAVAHALGRPLIADVIAIAPDANGPASVVRQALPRGARRQLRLSVPAVLVASAKATPATRYAYNDALRGKVLARQAGASPSDAAMPDWQLELARRQLLALAARATQSGHARMSGATGTASAQRSGIVLRDGSVQDKARALLDHLRAQSLIA